MRIGPLGNLFELLLPQGNAHPPNCLIQIELYEHAPVFVNRGNY